MRFNQRCVFTYSITLKKGILALSMLRHELYLQIGRGAASVNESANPGTSKHSAPHSGAK